MEYEWNLRQEEMDESDDDLDDKVSSNSASESLLLVPGRLDCVAEIILHETGSGLVTWTSFFAPSLILVGYHRFVRVLW